MATIDEKLNISINRGDMLPLTIKLKNKDGSDYFFQKGDVIRFKVFKKKDCNCVEVQKDITVEETSETVDLIITSQEMKIGDIIEKPVEYWYEVELNPDTDFTQTIIGYTLEDGAKILWLLPEGANKQ